MGKLVIAQNGIVTNLVADPDVATTSYAWRVADNYAVSVGDAFDPKDAQIDSADQVAFTILFRHENLIRELVRALRASSTTANTQATTAGLPTTANSADVTAAQFRTAVKALL